MRRPLAAVGGAAARHPWITLAVWVVLMAVAVGTAVTGVAGDSLFQRLKSEAPSADGESSQHSADCLRKKGIFGNRYGALHVTERNVHFVKAIMNTAIVAQVMNARGAKPMITFERGRIQRAEKVAMKKLHGLEISDGTTTERFWLDEKEIENVLRVLQRAV